MANTATPRSPNYNGWFYDAVNSRMDFYLRGTLVLRCGGNDLTVTDVLTAASAVIPGATTLNGVAYTWPAADGTSGFDLNTNGAGVLSWAT